MAQTLGFRLMRHVEVFEMVYCPEDSPSVLSTLSKLSQLGAAGVELSPANPLLPRVLLYVSLLPESSQSALGWSLSRE